MHAAPSRKRAIINWELREWGGPGKLGPFYLVETGLQISSFGMLVAHGGRSIRPATNIHQFFRGKYSGQVGRASMSSGVQNQFPRQAGHCCEVRFASNCVDDNSDDLHTGQFMDSIVKVAGAARPVAS